VNDRIRVPEIRLIDEQGENEGVVETATALARARELGLDLVEVSPKAQPPVCRIIDYGKYQYEQMKKERKQRKRNKRSKLKGIRLSTRISEHDLTMKAHNAERFLQQGDKIKVDVILRGREHLHVDLAIELLHKFRAALTLPTKFDAQPKKTGGSVSMIIYKAS
jgi:translation initiation factor IF-3